MIEGIRPRPTLDNSDVEESATGVLSFRATWIVVVDRPPVGTEEAQGSVPLTVQTQKPVNYSGSLLR